MDAERLWAPVSWWLITAAFGGTFTIAVGAYLGPTGAIVMTAVCAAAICVALLRGAGVVRVSEDGLEAAGAFLPWAAAGGVKVLDAEQTRVRMGTGADVRAFLVHRSYIPGAVEVEVVDPADPHPYWLVSTRHPERLARAIESHTRKVPA